MHKFEKFCDQKWLKRVDICFPGDPLWYLWVKIWYSKIEMEKKPPQKNNPYMPLFVGISTNRPWPKNLTPRRQLTIELNTLIGADYGRDCSIENVNLPWECLLKEILIKKMT